MRLLWVLLFCCSFAFGQNCRPEALENDKRLMTAGEFKGAALLNKLESLIKELETLSKVPYKGAQKNAMKYCLKIKDQLFQKLMVRPEPSIQENASFQATLAAFYRLHNDMQTALIYIDRAVEIEPRNLSLLIQNLKLFDETHKIELKEIADKPIALNETKRIFEEYSKRAGRIAEHPEATKPLAIKALTSQAKIAEALKNPTQEMQYWDKIITLDPTNDAAHQKRFQYFISKQLVTDSIEAMKRMTRYNIANDNNWNDFLLMLAEAEKWNDLISWTNKAPDKVIASKPDYKINLARAYIELTRIKDAQKIMATLPTQLKGKAATLALQNRSRLAEDNADQLKAEGRLSEALDEYKKALKNSPRPLSIKEKISLLIYEYRKGLKFSPAEATRVDLEEVVQLLEQSVYKTEITSSLFGIYLHSLKIIEKPTELKRACTRFKEIYPELIRAKAYISYCQ
ncbi:MAG: hypothetical protein R3A80_02555 [Bdellovibrionota bacterium]